MSSGNGRDNDSGDVDVSRLPSDFIERERRYSSKYRQEREIDPRDLAEIEREALENAVECPHCRTVLPNSLWRFHDCQNSENV